MSAELLRRLLEQGRIAAWHFCRHDDKDKSAPVALLRSLSAMLCHTLDGFAAALEGSEGLASALASAEAKEVFETLIAAPLKQVTAPARPQLMIIDALDEIPKEGQKPLLELIAK